jgi:hypothetical protein
MQLSSRSGLGAAVFSAQSAATCSRSFLVRGFFYPEDGGDVPPKRRFTQDVHSTTSQKTAFFIIKMNLKIECRGFDWIERAKTGDRCRALVNKKMNIRTPLISGSFLTNEEITSFRRRSLIHSVSYWFAQRIACETGHLYMLDT